MWPSKWPLSFLKKIEHTRSYRKNYLNDPMAADGAYWSETDFTYGTFPTARTYLSVDGAVTTSVPGFVVQIASWGSPSISSVIWVQRFTPS